MCKLCDSFNTLGNDEKAVVAVIVEISQRVIKLDRRYAPAFTAQSIAEAFDMPIQRAEEVLDNVAKAGFLEERVR